MANQAWLDQVQERLAKQALPPAYIRRFMDEVSDHFQDITEENMRTESNVLSRLGEPNQVAEAAVTAYRRRSFLGRHPTAAFFVFAVSPVASQFVLFILTLIGAKGVGAIAERLGLFSDHGKFIMPSPLALEVSYSMFSLIFVIIPTILAAILYCKLAKRLGIGKKWMFVSCLVLAAMAMLPCGFVRLGADAAGHVCVSGGFWIPFLHGLSICNLHILQLIQLTVPLAIGWWFIRRKRAQREMQLAS
jgi:hypothetical protein